MYKPDIIYNFTIKYSNRYTLKKFGVETIFTQKSQKTVQITHWNKHEFLK